MHTHLANLLVSPSQMKSAMNEHNNDLKKVYEHFRDKCVHPTDQNLQLEIISGNHSRAAKQNLRVDFPENTDLQK
jgi:hypothetical protein